MPYGEPLLNIEDILLVFNSPIYAIVPGHLMGTFHNIVRCLDAHENVLSGKQPPLCLVCPVCVYFLKREVFERLPTCQNVSDDLTQKEAIPRHQDCPQGLRIQY